MMAEELGLADLSMAGELTLDRVVSPPSIDPFKERCSRSVEPFTDPRLQTLQIGDKLECFNPCYRKTTVLKVSGRSAIVESWVMRNTPIWPQGQRFPKDNWTKFVWHEAWAVRAEEREDPDDPAHKWTEYHCTVTQEDRPPRDQQNSLLIGTHVRALGDDNPGDLTMFGMEPEKEEQPKPENLSDEQIAGHVKKMLTEPEREPRMTIGRAKHLAAEAGVDVSDITGAGSVEQILARIKEPANAGAQ